MTERTGRSTRRTRRGEGGQVVILVALSAIALLGATALAVDLTAQGSAHRSLQNWTDAAALSGIRDCDVACNAKSEVQDALNNVLANAPWSATTSWATSAPVGGCTSAACVVSNYAGPAPYSNYSVSVSSPPANPRNSSYTTTNYVEVDVAETNGTNLAEVLGVSTTVSRGHSIANNTGPPAPYQYSFFSKTYSASGNYPETITGDAYLGSGFTPQSGQGKGQDGLCINEIPSTNEPGGDSGSDNGTQDSDADDLGRPVFGTVPPVDSNGAPLPEPLYVHTTSPCPSGGNLNVQTGDPTTSAGCPPPATAWQDPSTSTWLCYEPLPPTPKIASPSVIAPLPCLGGAATIDKSTPEDVYSVAAGCAVTINFDPKSNSVPVNIDCISLVLGAGATVNVANKSATDYMTSYGFNPSGDAAVATAFTADGLPEPTTACPGASLAPNVAAADQSVIWAPDPGTLVAAPVLSNSLTGNSGTSDTLFIGTIFVPDQTISFSSNQYMEDVGSVYCGNWAVQSGAHGNPAVTYDPGATAPMASTERIVE